MAAKPLCSVPDCSNPVQARGYCSTHYSRWRLHGDVAILKSPPNGTLQQWIRDHSSHDGADCLLWPFSRNPSGYACQVRMDGRTNYAHDHMCRVAHGERPSPDHEVAHSCGRGRDGCINPNHLRWATRLENMHDMIAHGRTQRGVRHVGSKLNDDQIRSIRRLAGQVSQRKIARQFGVSQQLISAIIQRRKWGWLA